jgi:hypothetical protein
MLSVPWFLTPRKRRQVWDGTTFELVAEIEAPFRAVARCEGDGGATLFVASTAEDGCVHVIQTARSPK